MALAIPSRHHGTIRFYREPVRNGGGLIAVFPKEAGDRSDIRDCYVVSTGTYEEVRAAYLRTLRTPKDKPETRECAALIVRQIDARSDYVQSLMAPIR